MKRSGRRILIIVLSIMMIMTYMIPGSVFADTVTASDETAAPEVHEHDHAIEELSEGDDGADAITKDTADDPPAEDPAEEPEGEVIVEVPEAAEADGTEEAAEAAEEPADEIPAVEEPVTLKAASEPAEAPALRAAASSSTILAFTSDTHNKSGNVAANRLGTWLDKMAGIYGKKVDAMAFGGDMANASASQSDFWTLTQADMDQLSERSVTGVYTTGNHEYSPGNYSHDMNTTTQVYVENAEGIEGSNYRIYCLGSSAYAESSGSGSGWGWGMSGWNEYTSSQVTKLSNYLSGLDNSKVIIVITHYPLHYNPQRTITGASDVIDALNNASASGKKIVYLWGHNHTDADKSNGELNYDKIFKPGDTISYSSGNSKTIQFYYGAAGCMSDSEYGTGSGAVKGKGLILEINDENKLTFTYYDANANDVTEGGSYTEKDPVPVQSATIDEAGQTEKPTVEARRTLQLHYTTVPEDATVKSIAWSSSNESVATVDSTGKVRGVSEGRATITATISDGITRGTVTASVEIEVLAASNAEPMYVLTDTLEPDKNYIITNKNSSEAIAMTNNSGSIGLTTVEVEGDVIYTENENIVFTTEGSGSTVTAIGNNGYYLSAGNSSLSLTTSAPSNRTFAYGSDSKLTCKSGNSTYYIYYSTYNGGRYSSSTSASSSSSPREVYLFEEIGEQVAVTGVTVSPKTETVEARKTVQLTAIVAPENATNKKVTWSSSNESVATVDENGKVRGRSEGTAVITAAAGGFSDTCTVTVTPSTSTEQHYVITVDGNALTYDRSPNTANGGSSSYTYTGLAGAPYTSVEPADNMRFIFEETEGGYYIKDTEGNYLNATYTSGSNSGKGDLKLDDTPDVWVLDSGYSLENGTVDGSKLKSTNATNSAGSSSGAKYLSFEDSSNLFTVRSSSNADTITIEEATDPVAVTGVTVSPKTETVEARKTVQLTATVAPSNATNKKVTWRSSNTAVATVDDNGKVRGVAEGTAVITAAAGGFSDTCNVTVTPSTSTEPTYVITVGTMALSTEPTDDQLVNSGSGSQRYYYNGLAGVAFDPDEVPGDTVRWTLEPAGNGYYIKSLDGKYLNATYEQNSTQGYSGVLKVDDTPDIWVLDGTLDSWEVDGSLLKSTNASANASSDKYLAYEKGSTSSPLNLFTIRSESSASETTLVEADDPVAVTGVTVSPKTATVEARKTTQLTATVAPSNATNKKVTWSSGNTAVATVDENGTVKGVSAGTAVITATTTDGGKTDTCTVTVTPNDNPQTGYIIMIGGYALSTDTTTDQLSNNNGAYIYTGLAGVAYKDGDDAPDNIFWNIEETNGGYYIMSADGRYLNATYTSVSNPSSSNPTRGVLKLDNTSDVWTIDGTLEEWMVDGSMLKSTNSTKYLAYEEGSTSNPLNLFTIRSESNADETSLVDPTVTVVERYVETNTLEDGKEYIIGVNADSSGSSVYAVKNITGTSTGNTGSVTLEVKPASGSDPAYIETDDEGVVWKYTSSNQYMSTSNSHYLGYDSNNSYVPRVASTARAITYSGGKLSIGSNHYLTCDNGTFATSTSSSSGSTVRLFVKSIVIVECDHEYGEPTWTWTGNVKTRAAVTAKATFTCTKCGETITVDADVTEGTDASGETIYTATVTGPDGHTYTDVKAQAEEKQYTITISADKTEVAPGDEVTFTITLGPVDKFGSMLMKLDVGFGLTYVDKSFTIPDGLEAALGFVLVDWSDESMIYNGVATEADYVSTTDTVLATFKCTVDEGFTTSATVTIKDCEFATITTWEDLVDQYEIVPATVTYRAHTHTAGEAVKENETPATCTTEGSYDEVVYCTGCGEEMRRTHVTVDATGHEWGEATYVWADDNSEVTATRVCKNDPTHKETETVGTDYAVTTPATETTAGIGTYTTKAFKNSVFTEQTKTVEIPPTGYEVTYVWSEDKSTVTGTAVPYNTSAETITETVNTTSEITTDPTCTEAGEKTYTATFTKAQFTLQTATEPVAALNHDIVHHAAQAATCTEVGWDAYDTCSRCEYTTYVEIPANGHTLVHHERVDAQCEAAGTEEYWDCSVCKKLFIDSEGKTETTASAIVISATGHTPVTDTAVEPTCTETGLTEGSHCSVCNTVLTAQDIVPAKGHSYGEATYTWAADNSKATATHTCQNDPTHVEDETVDTTSSVTLAPTCTAKGETVYTATFTKEGFAQQTKPVETDMIPHTLTHHEKVDAQCEAAGTAEYWQCSVCEKLFSDAEGKTETTASAIVIPAKNHDWSEVAYVWADDNSEVTATRVCKNDPTHKETETVGTDYEVTTPATETTAGIGTYTTKAFTNSVFTEQTKDVEIPPTGYKVAYEWAEDMSSVTGNATPYNTSLETITENVKTTSEVTTEPTCTDTGVKTYTAEFTKPQFTTQTATEELPALGHDIVHHEAQEATCTEIGWAAYDTCSRCNYTTYVEIPAKGHDWEFAIFTWTGDDEGGYTAAVANYKCKNDADHTQMVNASLTSEHTAATCETDGRTVYTAAIAAADSLDNTAHSDTRTVVEKALGHDWGEAFYGWNEDNSKVKAIRTCKNDPEHLDSEEVETTVTVTVAPTCKAKGETVYTAIFTKEGFVKQTKTVELDMVDHTLVHHDGVAAQCEAAGTAEYWECSVCKKLFSDAEGTTEITASDIVIPATGHTPVTDPAKEATCQETGLTEGSHCSVCGKILVAQEVIPKTNHNYDEGVEIRPPVYTTPGLYRFTCTVCGDEKDYETGWVLEGEWTWRFLKNDGKWAAGEWINDNKGNCWIKEDGICAIDTWFTDPETGNLYYLEHGGYIARNKWAKDGDEWYYMNADGLITKNGWAKDSKGWCWLGADGKITKSKWIYYKSEWYYLKADGYMAANEWAKDGKGWMYMDGSGKITKSKWIQYKGDWYYLKADGYMAANEWAKDGKGWMYMDGSGKITKSKWIQYKGDWYYLKADGYMATGTQTIDGKTYKFDSSGRWIG